tara:strand:+ start:1073 stop:2071 length:999 start_codon:yes stop_codon:yes gene_type:complete
MNCNSAGQNWNSTYIKTFNIYHRAASTTFPNPNSWTLVGDWNGGVELPGRDDANNPSIGSQPTSLAATVNSGLPQTSANNGERTAFKYISGDDLPGEYFVVLQSVYNQTSTPGGSQSCACSSQGAQGDYQGYATLSIEDAYYNGWSTDPTTGAGIPDTGQALVYEYKVQKYGGLGSDITQANLPGPQGIQVWAQAKYGGNVRQFFTDQTLLTPWTPEPNPDPIIASNPAYFTFVGLNIPTPQNSGWNNIINAQSTWSSTEPLYMQRVSTPYFLAKFDQNGTVVEGTFTANSANPLTAGTVVKTAQIPWAGYPTGSGNVVEVPCPIFNSASYN